MNQRIRSDISRMAALREHCLPVLWVIGIGVGCSLTAFFVIRSWEHRNIEKAFLASADDRTSAVKGAFETELAMLELVRSSLISDGRIEREDSAKFSCPFLPDRMTFGPSSGSPAWRIVAGPSTRRPRAVTASRDFNSPSWTTGDSWSNRGGARSIPHLFHRPSTHNEAIYGYDVGSEPSRLATLRLACDTGKTIASERIVFAQDAKEDGFLVCLPVYEKNKTAETVAERRKTLMGFILGVFRPSEMIDSAWRNCNPKESTSA